MCKCFENICEKIKTRNKTYSGHEIVNVTSQQEKINIEGEFEYVVFFDFELGNGKTKKGISMAMSYCPFCGEQYD